MSKKDIIAKLGNPNSKKSNIWTYKGHLGPGHHSHRLDKVFKFKNEKVIEAYLKRTPISIWKAFPEGDIFKK